MIYETYVYWQGMQNGALHFKIKEMFIKYILYTEIFILYPISAKQLSIHKYITQNTLLIYFNLFCIHCPCGGLLLLSHEHYFIFYICVYSNSINSTLNKHVRYIVILIFKYPLFLVSCNHILVSWRFRNAASQKSCEKHLVHWCYFLFQTIPQYFIKTFGFFSGTFFGFSFGQLECWNSAVQIHAVCSHLMESMWLIL